MLTCLILPDILAGILNYLDTFPSSRVDICWFSLMHLDESWHLLMHLDTSRYLLPPLYTTLCTLLSTSWYSVSIRHCKCIKTYREVFFLHLDKSWYILIPVHTCRYLLKILDTCWCTWYIIYYIFSLLLWHMFTHASIGMWWLHTQMADRWTKLPYQRTRWVKPRRLTDGGLQWLTQRVVERQSTATPMMYKTIRHWKWALVGQRLPLVFIQFDICFEFY